MQRWTWAATILGFALVFGSVGTASAQLLDGGPIGREDAHIPDADLLRDGSGLRRDGGPDAGDDRMDAGPTEPGGPAGGALCSIHSGEVHPGRSDQEPGASAWGALALLGAAGAFALRRRR